MRKKDRAKNRWLLVFLTCLMAVPTIAVVMGIYPPDAPLNRLRPALAVGALLGVEHLLLRPVLRLLFAPVGCLTLGLFGLGIDIALIYVAASRVPGFDVPGFAYALVCALVINLVCAIVADRR